MEEPQLPPSDALASRAAQALRELQTRARSALSTRQDRLSQLEAEITRQIDALEETLTAQKAADAEAAASNGEIQAQFAQTQSQLDGQDRELRKRADQLAEFERQLKVREAAVDQRSAEFVQRDEELTQRQQELDLRAHGLERREEESSQSAQQVRNADGAAAAEREASWTAQHQALEQQRDELTATVARLEQETKSFEQKAADWRTQRAELERRIADSEAAAASRTSDSEAADAALEGERNELRAALIASREKVSTVEQQATQAAAERDELQQKFKLAHEDVQRFRARVAELEQDLAKRPAVGQADSTELVALRAERDALAERLEALQNEPAAPPNAADGQQLSELQRRFELAVEDVRDLKNKNAQLEAQRASARSQSGSQPDTGGMDWESQKRRMLASLEGETDDGDDERQQERQTIVDTIQITDAVVAEKDQEIKRLEARLAEQIPAPNAADEAHQAAVCELVDADEIIRQHRVRIAQHEQELEAKLRAAELELSVERAKIARQRVELDQLKVDLEITRKALPASGGPVVPTHGPKKRWLSKLGLSGDEQ